MRYAGGIFLFLALVTGWTLVVAPALVGVARELARSHGDIEFVLRIYFTYATGLCLLGLLYGLFARPAGDRRIRVVLAALAIAAVVLVCVWMLDPKPFTYESSAITFFNAVTILIASLLAGVNARAARMPRPGHRMAPLFWFLIASAFLLAALDEYFTIHETVGAMLQPYSRAAGLPAEFFQDGISISYVVGALLFIAVFFRCFRHELMRPGQMAGWLLLAGIGVYGVSVLNDTLDFLAERVFPLANPAYAMNFGEEALEFIAAVLFASSFCVALIERAPGAFDAWLPQPGERPRLRRAATVLLGIGAGLGILAPAVLAIALDSDPLAVSPADRFSVDVFADATTGLDSVDELIFVPGIGLLAGNEGTGQVLRFDPAGNASVFAADTPSPDGMAATDDAVYVVDETRREVLVFDHAGNRIRSIGGWQTPEGVAVDTSGAVYVADLVRRHVVSVLGDTAHIIASARDGLMSPEQLALDAAGNLYIADERTRTVFRRSPDGAVEPFLDRSDGIGVPESLTVHDGHLWISDSGLSAVHRYDLSGRGGVWLAFGTSYDLAGIALDDAGTLYVAIVSDYRPHNRILAIRSNAP